MTWKRYVAELVGTAVLVLVGTLSILAAGETGAPLLVVVPFGFGLGLLIALYAVGEVSGGHFNPAVSLGAFLDRRLGASDLIGYWVAQLAGGVVGSLAVLGMAGQAAVAETATRFQSVGQGFLSELLLTTLFVLVILAVTRSATFGSTALVAISLALAGVHFAGIPFSGASVNPARSLGPALVGAAWSGLWVYLVAPLLGGVAAWGLYRLVHEQAVPQEVGPVPSTVE